MAWAVLSVAFCVVRGVRLTHPRVSLPVCNITPPSAGCPKVVYDIEGFLEKNNDSLHDNLLDLLDTTVDPFLRRVVEYIDPEAGSEFLLPFSSRSSVSCGVHELVVVGVRADRQCANITARAR